MTAGYEIADDAFRMFEKWKEMFFPDDERDLVELAIDYARAPPEQHEAAAKAIGLKPPPPPRR